MRLPNTIRRWLRARPFWGSSEERLASRPSRGAVTHVIIIDGSLSSLADGCETNAGLVYKMLSEDGDRSISIRYEHGIQFPTWRSMRDVIEGRGINRQIRRVYGFLASRYRPGDRIFLFGYSRGAYAVRSLAGVIERIGLLRHDCATERHILVAYRHYERGAMSPVATKFRKLYCHDKTEIEMLGVWDTVKALGLRLPVLWRFTEPKHGFHNHRLGPHIRHAFQALALDETRVAFTPVLWDGTAGFEGEVQQMWFRGVHGDIGGQLNGFEAARKRSNIALVWMLEKAERCGLPLPEGWSRRFPQDIDAPSLGNWRGWGLIFLARRRREVGRDMSEALHPSVPAEQRNKLVAPPAAT